MGVGRSRASSLQSGRSLGRLVVVGVVHSGGREGVLGGVRAVRRVGLLVLLVGAAGHSLGVLVVGLSVLVGMGALVLAEVFASRLVCTVSLDST